jgi:hypothetical protein
MQGSLVHSTLLPVIGSRQVPPVAQTAQAPARPVTVAGNKLLGVLVEVVNDLDPVARRALRSTERRQRSRLSTEPSRRQLRQRHVRAAIEASPYRAATR